MKILGIETSCDDTAMAVVEVSAESNSARYDVLSNVISGQVEIHAKYGGVVPTLAAREHAKNFTPVLERALEEAALHGKPSGGQSPGAARGDRPPALRMRDIDLIAVTTHPGLVPSLIVGVHAARALAWWHKKPIIGIDHLEGHLAANLLSGDDGAGNGSTGVGSGNKEVRPHGHSEVGPRRSRPQFPAVALIVSGGHTQLVLMQSFLDYEVIGETRDDAAGEAFDKVAKLIGLPFPGGPPIAKLATKSKGANGFSFPRPMIDKDNFDFSFSGLKTAVLYAVRDRYPSTSLGASGMTDHFDIPEDEKAALCAEFQQAVVDVLVKKTVRAAKKHGVKTVMLGGGVAANSELRQQLGDAVADTLPSSTFHVPPSEYTVDNGAMIAVAAYLRWQTMSDKERTDASWQNVSVET